MDNSASLVPGRNPTGVPGYEGTIPQIGSTSGANPYLPQPNLPAGAPSANPFDTSVVPTFGANAGAYSTSNLLTPAPPGQTNVSTAAASPIGGINLMTPRDLGKLYGSLKASYGDGAAHALLDFLTTGAGFNQDAINNLFAALQPGINRGEEDLLNQFSTSGNRFSSGAEIGTADFLSQVNLNEGQIETQQYNQAIQNYMDVLMGTSKQIAQTTANSPSFLDTLGSAFGIGTSAAGGISSILSALNPNADTSILDVISSLG